MSDEPTPAEVLDQCFNSYGELLDDPLAALTAAGYKVIRADPELAEELRWLGDHTDSQFGGLVNRAADLIGGTDD